MHLTEQSRGMNYTWDPSLDREDPLEKEMATQCSTLAWEIPWTEEPGITESYMVYIRISVFYGSKFHTG